MDIAGLSTVLSTANLQSKVGIAVLDNALEASQATGAGVVEMIDAAAMERSVNPAVGGNIDMWV